jgi:hypothetical protein
MERIIADFSALEGTNCYCSADSAEQIRSRLAGLPLHAVHDIGTGDYHYISLFWLERIGEPFQLVLFDHHPDDQPGAFGAELISCGGWVALARQLPLMRGDLWIRDASDFALLDTLPDLPLYLSVDLDVLSPAYARTDWDQGRMTLNELSGALRRLRVGRRIIGVDLCGGNVPEKGASPEDLALNASTGEALWEIFRD